MVDTVAVCRGRAQTPVMRCARPGCWSAWLAWRWPEHPALALSHRRRHPTVAGTNEFTESATVYSTAIEHSVSLEPDPDHLEPDPTSDDIAPELGA